MKHTTKNYIEIKEELAVLKTKLNINKRTTDTLLLIHSLVLLCFMIGLIIIL